MKENELIRLYEKHPILPGLADTLCSSGPERINISGVSGSLKAIIIASIFHRTQSTNIVIVPEKEDAAYLYNDIVTLTGVESVFFFPSTFKRSILYEQTDPASIVLRTEVLNHLASGKRKSVIVTYPEAVMEKVISRKNLRKNTFTISSRFCI
jgi:transcription-repair coupling factor (superfamily II helicase)